MFVSILDGGMLPRRDYRRGSCRAIRGEASGRVRSACNQLAFLSPSRYRLDFRCHSIVAAGAYELGKPLQITILEGRDRVVSRTTALFRRAQRTVRGAPCSLTFLYAARSTPICTGAGGYIWHRHRHRHGHWHRHWHSFATCLRDRRVGGFTPT